LCASCGRPGAFATVHRRRQSLADLRIRTGTDDREPHTVGLFIGVFGTQRLFGLVDPDDIERRALAIVTTADRLDQDAEDYVHDLMVRGEWSWREHEDDEDEA
jgi:hypothetical protein